MFGLTLKEKSSSYQLPQAVPASHIKTRILRTIFRPKPAAHLVRLTGDYALLWHNTAHLVVVLSQCRAKSELDEERKSRLDSEEAASQLREQLQKAKQEQDKSQKSAAKQYEKLQQQFESLQVSALVFLPHRVSNFKQASLLAQATLHARKSNVSCMVNYKLVCCKLRREE